MTSTKEVNANHLSIAMLAQGMKHKLRVHDKSERDAVLARGDLQFSQLNSGIGIHCSDLRVTKCASSTTDIHPCVSFNVLTHGRVDYSLGEHLYHFNVTDKPIVFVNLITSEQVFTRHLFSEQRVRKANVTIDKSTLFSRCETKEDREALMSLFAGRTGVFNMPFEDEYHVLAEQLIKEKLNPGLFHQLRAEQLALGFIGKCLTAMLSQTVVKSPMYTKPSTVVLDRPRGGDHQLETALNKLVEENSSLDNVAKQMGISVSTLQRKVKANYNMTTFEYVRNKRLEKARNAIIIDGVSIGEAAYTAGYQHAANFVTAFKKYFDMTPAQLRKKHHIE